jgi:hypothetical protein
MNWLFRAKFGRDLFRSSKGRCAGAKNECGAMSNDAEAVIRPELATDEVLLWSGRPGTGLRFQAGDWFTLPFIVVWLGFVGFAFTSAIAHDGLSLELLFFTPFLLVGLFVLFGRYAIDILVRRQTCYGLSNERAIIVRNLFGTKVQSVSLKTLPEITLASKGDRIGAVALGNNPPWATRNGMISFSSFTSTGAPAFEEIDEPRLVYELVRQAQRIAQGHGAS